MSSDSSLDLENDAYYKKYQLLVAKCGEYQLYNERLVFRIQMVRKITKRRQRHIDYCKKRLDMYGDDWRNAPYKEEEIEVQPPKITGHSIIPSSLIKTEKQVLKNIKNETEKPSGKSVKKTPKRKATKSDKSEKDPNAPKRPANPFFQFCQEQRQILMEELNSALKPGEPEPSKQELTRQLAVKWKSLTGSDKKIYVDMYEKSKEKYAAEMSVYNSKNADNT